MAATDENPTTPPANTLPAGTETQQTPTDPTTQNKSSYSMRAMVPAKEIVPSLIVTIVKCDRALFVLSISKGSGQ